MSKVLSFRSRYSFRDLGVAFEQNRIQQRIDEFMMRLDVRNLKHLRRVTEAHVAHEKREADDQARKAAKSAALCAAQKRRALLRWDPHETWGAPKIPLAHVKKN